MRPAGDQFKLWTIALEAPKAYAPDVEPIY